MKAVYLVGLLLSSCTTAGRINVDGSIEGPTSFLGEAIAKNVIIKSPVGTISMEAFATHNPDRALTREVGRAILGLAAFKSADHVSDNRTSTENIEKSTQGAALIKGTKDPNVIPIDPNIRP